MSEPIAGNLNLQLWLVILSVCGTIISATTGWIFIRMWAQIDQLGVSHTTNAKGITDLALYVSTNHPTKADVSTMETRLNTNFDKLGAKLDLIYMKLDTKEDKA